MRSPLKSVLGSTLVASLLATTAAVGTLSPSPAHAIAPVAVIDADSLVVNQASEPRVWPYWPWDGDEPQIAVITYRSTPGVVGSTQVTAIGDTRELHSTAVRGTNVTIPDSQGRAAFSGVTLRTPAEMLAGRMPEILGTITVAFESDSTSTSTMSSVVRDTIVPAVRTQIAKLVEPLTLSAFASDAQLQDRFNRAVSAIKSAANLSFWQKIGVWLASLTDPDDRIGFKVSAFAAVDPSLWDMADSMLGGLIPASQGVGGALRPRTYTQDFVNADEGCNYRVTFRVS